MTVALLGKSLKESVHARQSFFITLRPEDGPEVLLDPKFWVHVSKRLKPGDHIEVLAETMEWAADLIVREAGDFGAKVAFYHGPVKLANDAAIDAPEEFEVKWAGPSAKFRVIRKADNKVLREEFPSKEDAATWLKNHRTALAA